MMNVSFMSSKLYSIKKIKNMDVFMLFFQIQFDHTLL